MSADQQLAPAERPEANPFGSSSKQAIGTVQVESQRAVAEVQAAIFLARQFPRNEIEATERILNACTRRTLAESATYVFDRGGTDITGPSVRLAECLAQHWGNLHFGVRELEQRNGESTVEAFAWDVQTGTRSSKLFQVKHQRDKRGGGEALTTQRDIYELVANQGARRMRACILAVIPGDVAEAAVAQCEKTLRATAEVTPDSITKLIEAFAKFGVTKDAIEKFNGRRMEAMQPAQLVRLRKIFRSLEDGMSAATDWFKPAIPPFPGVGEGATVTNVRVDDVKPKDDDAIPFDDAPKEAKPAEHKPEPAPVGRTPARRKPATPEPAGGGELPLGEPVEPLPSEILERKIIAEKIDRQAFADFLDQNALPPYPELTNHDCSQILRMWERVISQLIRR